jgi:hypothetical protein
MLALAHAEFDLFVKVDAGLSFRQHLPKFDSAVLRGKSIVSGDLAALCLNCTTSVGTIFLRAIGGLDR